MLLLMVNEREAQMTKSATPESGEEKLSIKFTIGRNKTVLVTGEYDHTACEVSDRIQFWEIVQQFGIELTTELVANYNTKLKKMVMCEVDLGVIIFEIETDANAEVRRKSIEAVQQTLEDALGKSAAPDDDADAGDEDDDDEGDDDYDDEDDYEDDYVGEEPADAPEVPQKNSEDGITMNGPDETQ